MGDTGKHILYLRKTAVAQEIEALYRGIIRGLTVPSGRAPDLAGERAVGERLGHVDPATLSRPIAPVQDGTPLVRQLPSERSPGLGLQQ